MGGPFGLEVLSMPPWDPNGYPELYYFGTVTPYLYNGKEMDRMNGLNEYDYGARWQEPTIGRWPTVDPLAELYYSVSPYAYCKNDPINYIDPDGRYSSNFWSDIVRFFTGGTKGPSYDNGNGNWGFNVTTGTGTNPTTTFHCGRNNNNSNTNQEIGSIPYGTASEQLTIFEKANHYEPSIDMKEASSEAIDLWAKLRYLINNNSDANQAKKIDPPVLGDIQS